MRRLCGVVAALALIGCSTIGEPTDPLIVDPGEGQSPEGEVVPDPAGGDPVEQDPIADPPPQPDPQPVAAWFQVDRLDCVSYCDSIGQTNVPSEEGARCASGENIPPSASGVVNYRYGCWPSCSPHLSGDNQASVGGNCYGDGQKRDGDGTDRTVGCHCITNP